MERTVEVAPGVRVRTSRRETTTSTVITSAGVALVVDPAWDPDELADLGRDLALAGLTVIAGFATHAHHDHVLWHPSLGHCPRWASPATASEADVRRPEHLTALGPAWAGDLAHLVGAVEPLTADMVPWPGPAAHLITHDGHSPGHTALWLPAAGVLVAGDMLSDIELPLPESTPPLPESTLPRPESTPPLPESTPPLPESTPPLAESTPPLAEPTPGPKHPGTPGLLRNKTPAEREFCTSTPPGVRPGIGDIADEGPARGEVAAGLRAYSDGLDALRDAVDAAAVLIPGHGRPTTRARARWEQDRRYVDALLEGRNPRDLRRARPGMGAVHRKNLSLAGWSRA